MVLYSTTSEAFCKLAWCSWAPDLVFRDMLSWKTRGKGKKKKEGGGGEKNQSWTKSRKATSCWLNIRSNYRCAFSLQMPKYVQNPFVSVSSYTQLTTQSWRREAAGSCSHAGKSMLPNVSVIPQINKQRKDGKRHQCEGCRRKGLSASSTLCCFRCFLWLYCVTSSVPRKVRGMSMPPATSWEGPQGTRMLLCAAQQWARGYRYRLSRQQVDIWRNVFKTGVARPWGRSPILGDTPTSSRQGPEEPKLCCTCFEWGLAQRAPEVPSASAMWWCHDSATYCSWYQEQWCHLFFIGHKSLNV